MTRAEAASRPGLGQYLGYAAGEVANNLTFQMASIFLLIYYTDVAGIPAAAAGTIFLVVRVWGGFTDLVAGHRIAIGLAVAVAVMLGYPLTEQRVRELVREMAVRNAATHPGTAAIASGTGSP